MKIQKKSRLLDSTVGYKGIFDGKVMASGVPGERGMSKYLTPTMPVNVGFPLPQIHNHLANGYYALGGHLHISLCSAELVNV